METKPMTDGEINRAICEKVFGLRREDCAWVDSMGSTIFHDDKAADFCNSWEAAGRLIEEMKERGFIVCLGDDGDIFACGFDFKDENGDVTLHTNEHDKNPCRAIALAALRAIESEGEP